jgi:hypothetical protein
MRMNRAYISTVDGITVVVNNRPYHVAYTDKAYDEIKTALFNDSSDQTFLDILSKVKRGVEAAVKLTPDMDYNGGSIMYRGTPMRGYAVDKLIELVHSGVDHTPLANFLEKLQKNPSAQTIEHLYTFLEYGRIPITKNGNFLAYKAIRKDWKDISSGTYDNSIGATPEMPRNACDDRRDMTCSYGLHVCSFEYLPRFVHAKGHVVLCEVDPADVVAIPNDYNNTKMRVCKYRVMGEVEDYYLDHKDILADKQVWDPSYTLYARVEDTDEWSDIKDFDQRDIAIQTAREELVEGGVNGEEWTEVKVMDEHGVVVYRDKRDA